MVFGGDKPLDKGREIVVHLGIRCHDGGFLRGTCREGADDQTESKEL